MFNTHERARTSLVKSMSSIVIVWVPLEPAGLEAGENMEQTLDPSMHASSLVATNPRKLNYATTSALYKHSAIYLQPISYSILNSPFLGLRYEFIPLSQLTVDGSHCYLN